MLAAQALAHRSAEVLPWPLCSAACSLDRPARPAAVAPKPRNALRRLKLGTFVAEVEGTLSSMDGFMEGVIRMVFNSLLVAMRRRRGSKWIPATGGSQEVGTGRQTFQWGETLTRIEVGLRMIRRRLRFSRKRSTMAPPVFLSTDRGDSDTSADGPCGRQFFVGGNDTHGNSITVRGNQRRVLRVPSFVPFEDEETESLTNTRADGRTVLPDAAGEHQRVHPLLHLALQRQIQSRPGFELFHATFPMGLVGDVMTFLMIADEVQDVFRLAPASALANGMRRTGARSASAGVTACSFSV
jgi:hypothetical protein